jgi:hypothetical protein
MVREVMMRTIDRESRAEISFQRTVRVRVSEQDLSAADGGESLIDRPHINIRDRGLVHSGKAASKAPTTSCSKLHRDPFFKTLSWTKIQHPRRARSTFCSVMPNINPCRPQTCS